MTWDWQLPRHQVLHDNPPLIYSGSLERLDFSEEGDDKGFYVVDIKGKEADPPKFQPVNARQFLTLRFTIQTTEEPNPMTTILSDIARHATKIKDSIVRVEISVPTPGTNIEEREIRKALSEAYYVASINVKAVGAVPRTRLGGVEGLTPLSALRLYLEQKKIPPQEMKRLLEYGEGLIQETLTPEP